MTLGAVLILSALLLFLHNRQEAERAGEEAEILMADLEQWMQAQETVAPIHRDEPDPEEGTEPAEEATEETIPAELPVVWVNGYDYVGYLEILALNLKLPVLGEWDYSRLQVAPCRQFGSSRTDDLVIAAHNFARHFGRLRTLSQGDTVTFTDMDGIVNTYAVAEIESIDPENVDAVLNSGHDLALYTCTPGGGTRVAVFCDRVEK